MRKFRMGKVGALVAMALLLSLAMAGSAFAGWAAIKNVNGSPSLRTLGSNTYETTLENAGALAPAPTLALDLTAINNGSATKVEWTAEYEGNDAISPASPSFSEATSNLSASGKAATTVTFSAIPRDGKFVLKAQLVSDGNTNVGSPAVVDVSFVSPQPVKGVTLNILNEETDKVSIRKNGTVELKAVVTPDDATNVAYEWDVDPKGNVSIDYINDVCTVVGLTYDTEATIKVTATGYNDSEDSASCVVRVAGKFEVTDDMTIVPEEGSAAEITATGLYNVDEDFIDLAYGITDIQDIAALSGVEGATLRIVQGTALKPEVDLRRSVIMPALGMTNYHDGVASAMCLTLEFDDSWKRGDMVPFLLAYNFDNMYYLDDGNTPASRPTTVSDFYKRYKLLKYFERDNREYYVDLTEVMYAKNPNSFVRFEGDLVQISPLIVMVDAVAPLDDDWCDVLTGETQQYGVRYDVENNLLFIYDGIANKTIEDPIVMQKIEYYEQEYYGGGGGSGGCSAGLGIAAAAALAGLFLLRKKSR